MKAACWVVVLAGWLAGMTAVQKVSHWAVPRVFHSVGSRVAVWVALSVVELAGY